MGDTTVRAAKQGFRLANPVSWLTASRLQGLVVVVAIVIHLAYQLAFREWYIEDSAICFAMARNIVEGEGIVPFAGGERIEAYSNPLWMLLLVLWQLVGIDGWTSSKIMAGLFGSATLPLVWLVAREALPDEGEGERSGAVGNPSALIAPLLLAGSAHHAIWSASALENSLFNFLLVLGAWLVLREDRTGARFPWSAIAFFGLGLTRPEGVMYAAIGGFWAMLFALRRGRGLKPALAWIVTFWTPYLLFVAWRIWYFAWPLPNTYYAKLGVSSKPLLRYYSRGWEQFRDFSQLTWSGYYLPLLPVALLGRQGWRGKLAAAVTVLVCGMLLTPGPFTIRWKWFWVLDIGEARWWLVTRILILTFFAVLLPFAAFAGNRGWRARGLVWHLALAAVFFSIYSDGDWMRGLRWMSLFAPTQAILFAVGVDEVISLLPRLTRQPRWGTAGWLAATLAVALWFPPNINFSRWYQGMKDDWPGMIRRRQAHTTRFADKLFLDERVRNLDMDMGAHLWWSDHWMVDMAGLVDVPMSLHNYGQRDFIQEYVYDERQPHFAHVHLRWSEIANFKSYPEWDDTFFQIRGYPDGQIFHEGIFARRSLVMRTEWEGTPGRAVEFARGVRLEGWDMPSPEVGRGRAMFVEAGFSTSFPRAEDDPFTVTLFLADGERRLASWDLPMGYTVMGAVAYPIEWWKPGEVFRGRFAVNVPPNLPEGTYDLGFVVHGARGWILPAGGDGELAVAEGAVVGGRDEVPARLSLGEVRFPDAVKVVPNPRVDELADGDRLASLSAAYEGRCDEAERLWRKARMHVPLHRGWKEQHEPEIGVALSRCLVQEAREAAPEARVGLLARAHDWDHRNPEYVAFSEEVADALYSEGKAARAAEDWETAYRRFSDVLRITPYYSWARRYAEEARDHRLGLYHEQHWDGSFGPW